MEEGAARLWVPVGDRWALVGDLEEEEEEEGAVGGRAGAP